MPSQRFGRSIRTLALSLLISAAPLAAQTMTPGGVLPAGAPQTTNADLLSRYLRELAGDPENLDALKGAGNAALEIGDTDAALALFTRAEKVAPRDGEVKAGIARALLKAENPRDALRMFDDAVRLGVPEAKIAGDRGLAYDLRGEPRRAQRDYQIALAARPDDEITRRYALSLAISGDREQALKQLQPQIYRRDAAAWRAQAFVLAMTGDPREAGKITHAMMPDPMADAMQPFLVRLAGLKPTEKALAVHLGRFPSDGTRMASNRRDETPAPTPAPAPAQLAAVTPPPPASRPTRGSQAAQAAAEANRQSLAATQAKVEQARAEQIAEAAPPPTRGGTQAPIRMTPEPRRGALADIMRNLQIPESETAAVLAETPTSAPARTRARPAPAPAPAATPPARGKGKTALASADAEDAKPAPATARGRKGKAAATEAVEDAKPVAKGRNGKALAAADDAKPDPKTKGKKGAKATAKAEPKHPSRIWVQVAGGSNKGDLDKDWSRVKSQAGGALKGRTAYTTPLRATNRLVTGPFKTMDEAQAFVNKMRKAGIQAFAVTSKDGQAVDKLEGK